MSKEEDGLSLLDWLQMRLPDAPDGYLGQLIRSGRVRLTGIPLTRQSRLACGDQIELPDSQRMQRLSAAAKPCQILAQNEKWIIVNKPAGLPVHRSAQHLDNLTDRLQDQLIREKAPFRVAPVQRLDIGTSGPVLFGKGRKAIGELGKLVMGQGLDKLYLALVEGHPAAEGPLENPLEINGKLKAAAGHFRTLRRWRNCSLLLVRITTGRKHQIRRHLAELGHPIAGDRRYRSSLPAFSGRLFLHQCLLHFVDPWLHSDIKITQPLPQELRSWLMGLEPELPEQRRPGAEMLK
ncbi:MAG TPA: RluA family pseudouridine synthase [Geothermobacteraceae bacterium]|nr:RluA family pseudouridine synthase [Geothermobacteraceae bacterium]